MVMKNQEALGLIPTRVVGSANIVAKVNCVYDVPWPQAYHTSV